MNNNTILIVGGTGYIGAHLKGTLSSCYELFISGTKAGSEANYFQIDFANPLTFKCLKGRKFSIIIITAASLTGLSKIDLTNIDLEINTIKLASFLQFISQEKVTDKIIYLSSMTVYAPSAHLPVQEDYKLEPLSIYGLSKKLAEEILSFFSERHNVQILITRLPGIFGGSRKSGYIYNIITKAVDNKKIIITTSGLGYWECMEISDLCNVISEIIKKYKWIRKIDFLNIGYGEKTDFIKTAEYIVQSIGSQSEILIEEPVEYDDFYMDNRKLLQLTYVPSNYYESLQKYIAICIDELRCR